ncbi:NDE1, mitochondrial external NADH dehydrogenase [Mycotypha africana]|uniref:NDE1, mitochondrial external NADH dehydrogenase n=1 Tax=Mycotypha africana TaxID=64632 RepID=UPI0023011648|nr:NDE1, mitochondrial external NADH dehydrogenase [Mycotypha africana]KAI8981627.1 NDE1, mitochondrial external NADH dehydrogenase [Mycotypha africana]
MFRELITNNHKHFSTSLQWRFYPTASKLITTRHAATATSSMNTQAVIGRHAVVTTSPVHSNVTLRLRISNFQMKHFIQTRTRTLGKSQGRIIILGSGWAGFRLIRDLNKKDYDVSVVSPRNHFVFTPLLASTAVGTLESRCITEPVRTYSKDINFYEAYCDKIDTKNQIIHCTSNIDDPVKKQFTLEYDKLVIAVGAYSKTFGIPGVKNYAYFLKEVNDARNIRKRLIDCFEYASQPGLNDKEKEDRLHFVVVGGGPTGVEFSAELYDFISSDLSRLYPNLIGKTRMTLYDVAPTILSSFDSHLARYASKKFARKGIQIKTERQVEKVEKNYLVIKGEGKVPYGMLVWSTGLMQNPLVESFTDAAKDTSGQRIETDGLLRVLNKETSQPYHNIYALGDCATIKEYDLPATAQVASQKAGYLVKALNAIAKSGDYTEADGKGFRFKNKGMMAYIGSYEALIDMSAVHNWAKMSGHLSWLLWRSAYLSKSVSIRNKLLIPYHWFLTLTLGRDISRF